MSKNIEDTLKLALEALEDRVSLMKWQIARDAVKEALAQPKQEPVAWATRMGEYAHIHWGAKRPEYPMVYEVPLYTTSPQRKPLTDERIADIVIEMNGNEPTALFWRDLAQAIEAAHGIKE